jgi:hypothetical protein
MAIDETTIRTRRSVLAASLAGVAAFAAGALGRAAPARAANDDPLQAGHVTTASATTGVTTTVGNGLQGMSSSNESGVYGENTGVGYGVAGRSATLVYAAMLAENTSSGTGLRVISNAGTGILATATTGAAVVGSNDAAPPPSTLTGVYGYSKEAGGGIGVYGLATTGTAVRAESPGNAALDVKGLARFDRSGKASVPKNARTVDVVPLGTLTNQSLILAVLMIDRPGVHVQAVRPNFPTAGTFRIYLNKVASTTASTKVAWFVVN